MLTVRRLDLRRRGGGVLRAYDTGHGGLPVFWHGGTPNTGLPPEPLFAAAERLGLRFLGADRPGYGGTGRDPDAALAAVVEDVRAVVDHLGIERFATVGHSGGGPRALAVAALMPARVLCAATIASPAPPDAEGLDRSAGMAGAVVREQEAASRGRAALTALLEREEFDPEVFTAEDRRALEGPWSWFDAVVRTATAEGVAGQVDDLLAQARPWGFDPAAIRVPLLVVHGEEDRVVPAAHGAWLASRVPGTEHRVVAGAGHLSVLDEAPEVLARLRDAWMPARGGVTGRPPAHDHRMDHRIEGHHLGDEPAETGDGRATTVHLGRVGVTGGFDLPGEFDLPPEERVTLVGDVPWELREAD